LIRVPYQIFTVTRGTAAAAGKSHLQASDSPPANMTIAMLVGGNLEEVADVTVIHAR